MADAKTITEHKAAFIRTQVRQLSIPLKPSPDWRNLTTNHPTSSDKKPEPSLSDKVVEDILNKVDAKIKTHNRNVFALQSQRHVAEQIDTLFWNEVSADNVKADVDTTWVKRNVDLSETETIHELPERYRDLHFHPDHEAVERDVKRYGEMRARLDDLAKERDEKQRQVKAYRELRDLLKPFENARESIQPSLVTKDGELSRELERMKMLITRVTARLGQVTTGTGKDMNETAPDNEQKLTHVLGLR